LVANNYVQVFVSHKPTYLELNLTTTARC